MKVIFLNLLLLISSFSYGQNENTSSKSLNYNTQITGNLLSNGIWIPRKIDNEIIEGSKYLFEDWNDDYLVVDLQGNEFKLTNLNYDIVAKELETKISNDSIFIYNYNNLDYFVHKKQIYKIYNEQVFLQVSNNEKFSLLKQFSVSIQNAVINPMTKEEMSPKKYILHTKYKILKENKLYDFKLNKKSFLDFFPNAKDEVLTFVKQNKLSFSNESDAVRILKHMDELN